MLLLPTRFQFKYYFQFKSFYYYEYESKEFLSNILSSISNAVETIQNEYLDTLVFHLKAKHFLVFYSTFCAVPEHAMGNVLYKTNRNLTREHCNIENSLYLSLSTQDIAQLCNIHLRNSHSVHTNGELTSILDYFLASSKKFM